MICALLRLLVLQEQFETPISVGNAHAPSLVKIAFAGLFWASIKGVSPTQVCFVNLIATTGLPSLHCKTSPVIKSLVISIWAIIVTVAVVFVPGLLAGGGEDGEPAPATLIDHRTNTMSAALFERGRVIGHFTTRIHYQLPDGAIDPDVIPIDQIIMDGLFELIHQMKPKDMAKLRERDLMGMGEDLAVLLNNRSTPLPIQNVRFDSARLMVKSVVR